jgi:hypothetical protein
LSCDFEERVEGGEGRVFTFGHILIHFLFGFGNQSEELL